MQTHLIKTQTGDGNSLARRLVARLVGKQTAVAEPPQSKKEQFSSIKADKLFM